MSATSIPPNQVTYMYMFIKPYKGENMKIGKDDDDAAAAAALRSRHTAAIVQAVGRCLGARTFRRQLKRRLRGAVCTTPNTILLYIFACARCILVGDGGAAVSIIIIILFSHKYLLPRISSGSSSFRFPIRRTVIRTK